MLTEPPHYLDLLNVRERQVWRDDLVPLAKRGVRGTWLTKLVDSLTWYANQPVREAEKRYEQYANQARAAMWLDNVPEPEPVPAPPKPVVYTTRELVSAHILPLTQAIRAPLYALAPETERGTPQLFVSHSWDAFTYLQGAGFGTLDSVLNIKEEFLWIDIACYNQHTFEAVAKDMESVIQSIGAIGFAITHAALFDRIWCLWELLCAARASDRDLRLLHGIGHQQDMMRVENACFESFSSVEKAQALKDEDRKDILGQIRRHFGTFEAADSYIRHLMHSFPRLRPEYRKRQT